MKKQQLQVMSLLLQAEAVEAVPAFTQLESQALTLPGAAVDLLHWVLVDLKEPSLSVVDKSEVCLILICIPTSLPMKYLHAVLCVSMFSPIVYNLNRDVLFICFTLSL